MPARLTLLIASGLALSILSGCGRIEQTRRCQSLAQSVNARLSTIESLHAKAPHDPTTFEAIARHYEELAQEISEFPSDDKRLRGYLTKYSDVFRKASAGAALVQRGLKSKKKKLVIRGKDALIKATGKNKAYARRIDTLCPNG